MPSFVLPAGWRGWVVAGVGALAGMIAGGITINVLGRAWGK